MSSYRERAKLRFAGFQVHKPTILITDGTDIIRFKLETKTPFPAMGYPAVLEIKTAHCYAETWLKEELGITEYEVIDTTKRNP
jgi:hypothetical protein